MQITVTKNPHIERAILDAIKHYGACNWSLVYDAVVNTCVYQRLNYDKLAKLRAGLCRLILWHRAQREAA